MKNKLYVYMKNKCNINKCNYETNYKIHQLLFKNFLHILFTKSEFDRKNYVLLNLNDK